jgi:hypothetical protein
MSIGRRQTDHTYSREMLDEKFNGVHAAIGEIKEITTEGLKQSRLTNGRVNDIEKWKDQVQGAIKMLGLLAVPVVLFIIYKLLS